MLFLDVISYCLFFLIFFVSSLVFTLLFRFCNWPYGFCASTLIISNWTELLFGAHAASCSIGNSVFPRGKAAGAWG